MEIKEAIRKRKSIRGYKPDPVSRDILEDILRTAVRAPSALNTQPWEIITITGEPLARYRKAVEGMLAAGISPTPDLFGDNTGGHPFAGVYRDRMRELGFTLYGLMGIARDDRTGRDAWKKKGILLFGAPAVFIIAADAVLNPIIASSDIGGLAQTICLAALAHGLGTCINLEGVTYPQIIREITGLPQTKKMFLNIAIGYPDWDHPANKLETSRESLDQNSFWYGF